MDTQLNSSLKPLIAFCGDIGAGKTHAARILAADAYEHLSWAYHVKRACAQIWGLPVDLLEGKTAEAREWREQPHPELTEEFHAPTTPRWLLQHFGTDACRAWHPLIWVNACARDIRQWQATGTPVVLDDTRFPNECARVRDMGGIVVRVERPGNHPPTTNHASEGSITDAMVDETITNDGTDSFRGVVLAVAGYVLAEKSCDFLAGSRPHGGHDIEECEACQ